MFQSNMSVCGCLKEGVTLGENPHPILSQCRVAEMRNLNFQLSTVNTDDSLSELSDSKCISGIRKGFTWRVHRFSQNE